MKTKHTQTLGHKEGSYRRQVYVQYHWLSPKCKSKLLRDSILHLSGWLRSTEQATAHAGEGVEYKENSSKAVGSADLYSHCGKQCVGPSGRWEWIYLSTCQLQGQQQNAPQRGKNENSSQPDLVSKALSNVRSLMPAGLLPAYLNMVQFETQFSGVIQSSSGAQGGKISSKLNISLRT